LNATEVENAINELLKSGDLYTPAKGEIEKI
jgi:hypothetical protein